MAWKASALPKIGCKGSVPVECLKENAESIECFIRKHGTRPYYVEHYNGASVDSAYEAETCAEYLRNLRKSGDERYKEDPNLYLP